MFNCNGVGVDGRKVRRDDGVFDGWAFDRLLRQFLCVIHQIRSELVASVMLHRRNIHMRLGTGIAVVAFVTISILAFIIYSWNYSVIAEEVAGPTVTDPSWDEEPRFVVNNSNPSPNSSHSWGDSDLSVSDLNPSPSPSHEDSEGTEQVESFVDDPAGAVGTQFRLDHLSMSENNSLRASNVITHVAIAGEPELGTLDDDTETYDYYVELEEKSKEKDEDNGGKGKNEDHGGEEKDDNGNPKGLIEWFPPRKDRYLMMVCGFGQMSNRIICILNHLVAASLLNRTLIFPLSELGYPFDKIFDIQRITECLGKSAVISLADYRNMTREAVNIDIMREVQTFVYHKFRKTAVERFMNLTGVQVLRTEEDWSGKQDRESVRGFFGRLDSDAKVMSIGDGFDVKIGDEARRQLEGHQIWQMKCQGPILQPHPNILKAALGFVRTFLGTHYSSIHLRRSDFMSFCGHRGCYFPIAQVAECLQRQLHPSKTGGASEIVYLATDASPEEVSELQTLLRLFKDWDARSPTLVTLDGMPGSHLKPLGERELPRRAWNIALMDTQLNSLETRAMLDRTICAMGVVFLSSPFSTFSKEVYRMRTAWKLLNQGDSKLCTGVKADWKQPPWS